MTAHPIASSDLPELPEPNSYCTHADRHEYDVYDAQQMRDYGTSCILAQQAVEEELRKQIELLELAQQHPGYQSNGVRVGCQLVTEQEYKAIASHTAQDKELSVEYVFPELMTAAEYLTYKGARGASEDWKNGYTACMNYASKLRVASPQLPVAEQPAGQAVSDAEIVEWSKQFGQYEESRWGADTNPVPQFHSSAISIVKMVRALLASPHSPVAQMSGDAMMTLGDAKKVLGLPDFVHRLHFDDAHTVLGSGDAIHALQARIHSASHPSNAATVPQVVQAPTYPISYVLTDAEHLAKSAESFIEYLNDKSDIDDGFIKPDDHYGDYTGAIRVAIHEFRKRRDRYNASLLTTASNAGEAAQGD